MTPMEHDFFYDTSKFSYQEQVALLRKAHSICESWWFDKLDCSISWQRQRVHDISFEEAISHFGERSLLNVIHRRPIASMDAPHLEVGFRAMESPVDCFLWIIVPLDRADEITNGLDQMSWGLR
jgi:hypothetical protein